MLQYHFDLFHFRWINTKKSVWGLEGFFLRLRLGKWEEGLGGTGYHVARIEGIIFANNHLLEFIRMFLEFVTQCWFLTTYI